MNTGQEMATNKGWETQAIIRTKLSGLSIVLLASFCVCVIGTTLFDGNRSQTRQSNFVSLYLPTCIIGRFELLNSTQPEIVKLYVDFDGRTLLNGQEIGQSELRRYLFKLTENKTAFLVDLKTNPLAEFASFYNTLDLVRISGIDFVNIVEPSYNR